MRWWDGVRWTDHIHARQGPPPPNGPPVTGLAPPQPSAPASSPPRAPEPTVGVPPPSPTVSDGHQLDAAPAGGRVDLPRSLVTRPQAKGLGAKGQLQRENEELRVALESLGVGERERLLQEVERLAAEASQQRAELLQLQQEVIETREQAILQEVGIYEYRHPLDSAVAYKERLDQLKREYKALAKQEGGAVEGATSWTVNGSASEGRKMVRDFSKLMLRAYNNEADNAVRSMRPFALESAKRRLDKSAITIVKLGRSMNIHITDAYHRLRLLELELTADFLAKKEEEKEAEREERARLREEAKAQKELEREKEKLEKERTHYEQAVERLRASGASADEVADAEAKLANVDDAIEGIQDRAANIRAGYVYVISNVGSFGERMVKIGMTWRLEPMDRVRELGDASVPFRYDVHALIFSDDAVTLETQLHQRLAEKRVNRVNLRREFFYATPLEVKHLLEDLEGSLVEYADEPEALEWHQSSNDIGG